MPVVMIVPVWVVLLIPLPVHSVGQDACDQGYPGQHSVEASSQDIDPGHIMGHLRQQYKTAGWSLSIASLVHFAYTTKAYAETGQHQVGMLLLQVSCKPKVRMDCLPLLAPHRSPCVRGSRL